MTMVAGQGGIRVQPELTIGIISDTHGVLRSEALAQIKGADHIIHAGDIGAPEIVGELRALAPTTAIRGNIDKGGWAAAYPGADTLRLGGLCIHVVHDLADLRPDVLRGGVDVVISGHSHRPKVETRDGVLFLNPGSAGPKRFKLPVTVASLTISGRQVSPQVHHLAV